MLAGMMVPRVCVVVGIFCRSIYCIARSYVAVQLNSDSAFVKSLIDIKGVPSSFP